MQIIMISFTKMQEPLMLIETKNQRGTTVKRTIKQDKYIFLNNPTITISVDKGSGSWTQIHQLMDSSLIHTSNDSRILQPWEFLEDLLMKSTTIFHKLQFTIEQKLIAILELIKIIFRCNSAKLLLITKEKLLCKLCKLRFKNKNT